MARDPYRRHTRRIQRAMRKNGGSPYGVLIVGPDEPFGLIILAALGRWAFRHRSAFYPFWVALAAFIAAGAAHGHHARWWIPVTVITAVTTVILAFPLSVMRRHGYRACALAHENDIVTIGLDAEPHDELPDGVVKAVSLAPERERVAELTAAVPGVCWDRLLFCVKESVYKAWFPLTGRWLGFEEACVDFDPASQSFAARLLVAGPVVNGHALTGFTGRWLIGNGLIVTAIVIPKTNWP
jgi:hypothetical protein